MSIVLKNINKKFNVNGKEKIIFSDVNIVFENSGLYQLDGYSGSGKTTLLNIIGMFDFPDSGIYQINGAEITKEKFSQYRQYITYLDQNSEILNDFTVLENVMLVTEFEDVAIKFIDYVGLGEYVNQKANLLSGGEKTRVALARELARGTSIILLDEPTANLDYDNAYKIMQLLKKISQDKLVIIASHDIELVCEFADKIIHISPIIDVEGENDKIELINNAKLHFDYKFIKKYILNLLKYSKVRTLFIFLVLILLISISIFFLQSVFYHPADTIKNYFQEYNITNISIKKKTNDNSPSIAGGRHIENLIEKSGFDYYYVLPIKVDGIYESKLLITDRDDFEGIKVTSGHLELNHKKIGDNINLAISDPNYSDIFLGVFDFVINEIIETGYNGYENPKTIYDENYFLMSEVYFKSAILKNQIEYKYSNFLLTDREFAETKTLFVDGGQYDLKENEIVISNKFYDEYQDYIEPNKIYNYCSDNDFGFSFSSYLKDFKIKEVVNGEKEFIAVNKNLYNELVEKYLIYNTAEFYVNGKYEQVIDYVLENDMLIDMELLTYSDSNIYETRIITSVLTVFSCLLISLVIFWFTANLLANDNKNLSLFRIIGYSKKEISKIYISATLMTTVLALIFGLICGIGLFYLNNIFYPASVNYLYYRLHMWPLFIAIIIALVSAFIGIIIKLRTYFRKNISVIIKNK